MTAALRVWAIVPAAGLGRRFAAAGKRAKTGEEKRSGASRALSHGLENRANASGRDTGTLRRGAAHHAVEGQTDKQRDDEHATLAACHLPKQMHFVRGKPMLVHLLDTLLASRVTGVVAVVNELILEPIRRERPEQARLRYALNHNPDSEMYESVRIGLNAMPSRRDTGSRGSDSQTDRADSCLIVPGDYPFLSAAAVDCCLAAFETAPEHVIIAAYRGRRGHPIILPPDLTTGVRDGSLAGPLNRLRERFCDRVRLIEVEEPGVLRDVDAPADLKEIG